MRILILATGLTVSLGAVLVAAADPRDATPEARAYFGFHWSSSPDASRASIPFFYGLRLDADSRFSEQPPAPIAQLEFDRLGLSAARLNGMDLVHRDVRLNQNEGTGDQGTGEEPEGQAPAKKEVHYTWTDWGLLAAGAGGLGFGIVEIVKGKHNHPRAQPSGGTTGGTTTGGTPVGGTPVGGTPLGLTSFQRSDPSDADRERLMWLDGGTGQMGDLDPQPEAQEQKLPH